MKGAKKKFTIVCLFLAMVFWTAAGIWFIRSLSDSERSSVQIGEAQDLAKASEIEIPTAEATEVDSGNSGVKLLSVDLTKLIQKNPDTAGWVQITGTNIDYPFVQTKNNDFYHNHSFDKSYNPAGWVFLDSENSKNLTSEHSILYLHGKIEGTEFEPARSMISSSSWLNHPEQFVMRTSTNYSNEIWQIFSIYKIPTTQDYLVIDFESPAEKMALVEKLKGRSVYNFEVPFSETDRMLTFSIRYDDEYIVAVHGKLVVPESEVVE